MLPSRGVYEVAIRVQELSRAEALRGHGVAVRGPVSHAWMPATSIYFTDPGSRRP